MPETSNILFRDGEPVRIVEEDTTLSEVEQYHEREFGSRAAHFATFKIKKVPHHPEL